MIEGKGLGTSGTRLRYGLVGGGAGSFIAAVHRMALNMTLAADLTAGCFSRDTQKNKAAAEGLNVAAERTYASYKEMAEHEAAREDRIDFAVVTTPNNTHYDVCRAFLEKGINISCDKPLCFTVDEALTLARLARDKGLLFMVTYPYTSYPLIRHARELVRSGQLGDIRVVVAEYAQDWLADSVENKGNIQAAWRTDPKQSGISGCVGDIGTHVENMVHFVTGLAIEKVSAMFNTFVKGRLLEDNAMITVKYKGGAVGHYWPSQVAVGKENGFTLRIYGTEASIEWGQETPEMLRFTKKGQPPMVLTRGGPGIGEAASRWTRLPSGHPEGLFAAWANLYEAFCNTLKNKKNNCAPDEFDFFPTVMDGVRGVKFVHDCVKSSKTDSAWVDGTAPIL